MSNTDSSGNPDQISPDDIVIRRPSRLLVITGVVVLILAFYIGTQVLGVLYGLIFPPSAPLPSDVTELRHKNTGHGADEWTYGTDLHGCEVVQFYLNQGGTCQIAPNMCDPGSEPNPNTPGQQVANCSGEIKFSIFAMKWETNIASGYRADGQTHFLLSREVFWNGSLPPATTAP